MSKTWKWIADWFVAIILRPIRFSITVIAVMLACATLQIGMTADWSAVLPPEVPSGE